MINVKNKRFSWVKFFKPTRKKVILSIILTIIYVSFLVIGLTLLVDYISTIKRFIEAFNLPDASTKFNLEARAMYNGLIANFIVQALASLVSYYLISCMLLWIFYEE